MRLFLTSSPGEAWANEYLHELMNTVTQTITPNTENPHNDTTKLLHNHSAIMHKSQEQTFLKKNLFQTSSFAAKTNSKFKLTWLLFEFVWSLTLLGRNEPSLEIPLDEDYGTIFRQFLNILAVSLNVSLRAAKVEF